jgi:L,D-transpeptidase ErfK/SrfK
MFVLGRLLWRRGRPWPDLVPAMVIALGAVLALAGAPASAATYALAPGQNLIGEVQRYTTRPENTLLDIARDYDVGYTQLMAANRSAKIDPWLPGAGKAVVIPTAYLLPDAPRTGIVINLGEQRLYYYHPGGKVVETVPIGIGVVGRTTPIGSTRVVAKRPNPAWNVPKSIRREKPELPAVVPPGPDNPLGAFALYLGWPSYLIHGTNLPYGVGRDTSHGCIRLYPEDIARLFREVPVGTPVHVVYQDYKVAWARGELYLEIHPTKDQGDQLELTGDFSPAPIADLIGRVVQVAGSEVGRLDWNAIRSAAVARSGIPIRITEPLQVSRAAN